MISLPAIADHIGRAVLHSVWEGVLLALLFFIAGVFLRQRSASLRYWLGCATLLAMVIAPIATVLVRPSPETTVVIAPRTAEVQSQPVSFAPMTVAGPPTVARRTDPPLLQLTAAIWMLGLVAVSLWQFAGWVTVRNLVRRSLPADPYRVEQLQRLCDRVHIRFSVAMRVCDQLTTPALVGWLQPVILIPPAALCDLPVDYFESLLLHELAHVQRHDYLANLLQIAAETLLFYHPAAWWVGSCIRRERENCCDDEAARRTGAMTHARALAAMEVLRSTGSPHLALGASGGNLLKRIERLMSPPTKARNVAPMLLLAAVALGVLAVVPSQLLHHAAAQTKSPQTQPADPKVEADQKWEYRFEATDRVELTIHFADTGDIVQMLSVDANGDITLSAMPGHRVLGETIHAAGLTPADLEHAVYALVAVDASVGNTTVRAVALDAENSVYFVGGHVKRAGSYQMRFDRRKIRNAVIAAEIDEPADQLKNIRIIRHWPAGTGNRIINLDAAKVLANDPLSNIEVRPRDEIQVGTAPAPEAAPELPRKLPQQARADEAKSPRDAILPEDLIEPEPPKVIRLGDTILLPSLPDPLRGFTSAYVGNDGRLNVDFLRSFVAAGMTHAELKKEVADAYRARGYPDLLVLSVITVAHNPADDIEITITGSRLGGHFRAPNRMRLLEAVMQAKGKNEPRARRIHVVRTDPQHSNVDRRIEIPVDKLLAGDYACNIVLRNNDRIVVEPSE